MRYWRLVDLKEFANLVGLFTRCVKREANNLIGS